ncbi:hypothetical protein ACVWXV_001095 [Thermostichus sp. OS-CIW-21]
MEGIPKGMSLDGVSICSAPACFQPDLCFFPCFLEIRDSIAGYWIG